MARNPSPTILQEELYPPSADRFQDELAREQLDDARLIDLDADEESPFLRAQRRVSARRSALPRKTAHSLLRGTVVAAILCAAALAAGGLYRYGQRSWRFRVESSDNIEVTGTENVSKAQIMEVMGADIGRNIFFVPLTQQQAQLEQIPWVESASVMRFLPNRLKVEIHERTPVAFARVGPRISLVDGGGTLMELPRKHKYSFPVILGMNPGEPLSTRLPRMNAYNQLVQELDSGGARYSEDLSEVDLSDLDDLKVRVNDPAGNVLLHLGSSDYLNRYKVYVSHVQEWRQQFQKLESVNLRYDNQVIVNPDMEGKPKAALLAAAAAKEAVSAGVKPAALTTRVGSHDRAIPKPAFELSQKKLDPKAATKKPAAKGKAKRTRAKATNNTAPNRAASKDATQKSKAGVGSPPAAPPKPEAKKSEQLAPPPAANAASSKPSPAIAKDPANTGPN